MHNIIEIPLTQGRVALIDAEDFEKVSKYKWRTRVAKNTCYAVYYFPRINNSTTAVLNMHRLIMGVTDSKVHIDHIDRNGLNNSKDNLRLATIAQNSTNRGPHCDAKSKYKGVVQGRTKLNGTKTWRSFILESGKFRSLGTFYSEDEAARVYNDAAKKQHGEFAYLNPV